MILDVLDEMRVPYLIVRYVVSCPLIEGMEKFRYQIFTHRRPAAPLGFKPECEIRRYMGRYMYRNLKPNEARIFRSLAIQPSHLSEHGIIWEFNGLVNRRRHPLSAGFGLAEFNEK